MSGLSVRYHRDSRPLDAASIWAMLEAIPYRGPDGMSVRTWDTVGAGFAKMTVTPEEVDETQPLVSPRTGVAIIADVRLDNRDELFARLPESLPATISDAELILRAYEAWGEDSISRLLGDFALVIWDGRQQRLVCARDTSGQRALFYHLDEHTFAAASEIHQLFQDSTVPIQPNSERILSFLTPQNMFQNEKQEHETFYEGIFLLPAGHTLVVERETTSLSPYWQLQPESVRYRSDEEYVDHFRQLFFDAVRSRLRSIHPVGVMLSGGLDSSSIACSAQQMYQRGDIVDNGFASYSFVFGGLNCDETPYIEATRARYGFESHYLSAGTFGGRLQKQPSVFLEGPNVGIRESSAILFEAAQEHGTRVLLNGDVADACIGGSPLVFDSLLRKGRLREFAHRMKHYRRTSGSSTRRIVALFCVAPLLPPGAQRRIMVWQRERATAQSKHLLLPGWMPEPLRQQLANRAASIALETERTRQFSNQTLHYEAGMLYPPQIARYPAPWSIQVARPFADRRLHQFLMGIPPEQKYRPHPEVDDYYAGSKWLLRRAMADIVPDEIRLRTMKTTFESVHKNELVYQWPLYEEIFHPSGQSEIGQRGLIDPERFWSRLQELRIQPEAKDATYIMQLVGMESWLRSLQVARSALPPAAPRDLTTPLVGD